ncbi:MAG: signal peptidase I [Verrucomicrobia bacterium]|nr:signal peptidase I [Verrucomicrobiota bacterium]
MRLVSLKINRPLAGAKTGDEPLPARARPQPQLPARLRPYVIVLLSIFSYLFFSRCILSTVEVCGLSMIPTLHNGDRYFLDRFSYWHRTPQRGELVVLRDPEHGEYAVKRVVALPHERVVMQRNIAYIDGHRLMEPYLPASAVATLDAMMERPVVVADEHFFVLGDNRDNSEDSRHYGAVSRRNIVGVLKVGHQPQAFLRTPGASPFNHARMVPLPTLSAHAAERTPKPASGGR